MKLINFNKNITWVSIWLMFFAFCPSTFTVLYAHGSHGHSHESHSDKEENLKKKKKRSKKNTRRKRKSKKKKRKKSHSHGHSHSHSGFSFGASAGYRTVFAAEVEDGEETEATSVSSSGGHAGHNHGGGAAGPEGDGLYVTGNLGYQFNRNIGASVSAGYGSEGLSDPGASLFGSLQVNKNWKFNANAGLVAPLSAESSEQGLTTKITIAGGPAYKQKRFTASVEGRFSKSIYGVAAEEEHHDEEEEFGAEEDHEEEHEHAKQDMSFGGSFTLGYRVTRKLTVTATAGLDQITNLAEEEHHDEEEEFGAEEEDHDEEHTGISYVTSVEVVRATYNLGQFSVAASFSMSGSGETITMPDTPGVSFELSYELH